MERRLLRETGMLLDSVPIPLVQSLRNSVSLALSTQGVDPLGISRKLLLNEAVASEPLEWLRFVGYVHLYTASGIHLYVLADAARAALLRVGRLFRFSPLTLSCAVPGALFFAWFGIWALSGFRMGLLRPLLLVGYRTYCRHFGLRPLFLAPLLLSLAFDAGVSAFRALSPMQDFVDVSAGSLHYGLAVGGGVLGYEWAKQRGWEGLRAHLALAFFSWVTTALLDFSQGIFSPVTPLLSLLSIPVLAYVFYPALLIGVFWPTLLLWSSAILNRGVAGSSVLITQGGGVREIEPEGAWLSGLLALFTVFLGALLVQRRRRPPSTTCTSPVTQAASSLRRKRIEFATSRGSPTRPSGKAAPRRA